MEVVTSPLFVDETDAIDAIDETVEDAVEVIDVVIVSATGETLFCSSEDRTGVVISKVNVLVVVADVAMSVDDAFPQSSKDGLGFGGGGSSDTDVRAAGTLFLSTLVVIPLPSSMSCFEGAAIFPPVTASLLPLPQQPPPGFSITLVGVGPLNLANRGSSVIRLLLPHGKNGATIGN